MPCTTISAAPAAVEKYTFKYPDMSSAELNERRIICPGCSEMLSRLDIEAYSKCPFCNHVFKSSPELEDFLLDPLVDSWMRSQYESSGYDG